MNIRSGLELYLTDLADSRRVSLQTQQGYSSDLSDLISYLESISVNLTTELKPHHLNAYLRDLRHKGRTNATIARRIVSMRAYCKYLTLRKAVESDPAILLEAPAADRREPRTIQIDQVTRLMESPDTNQAIGLRDRAMLELLYATGLRVSELISLDIEQVKLDIGLLMCISSSGRERIVPIGGQGADWVRQYLQKSRPYLIRENNRSALQEPAGQTGALFLNHSGERLTRQGFWKTLKKYAEQSDLELTPHTLRHSFASHMLDNGADVRAVQEMLGHSAASTMQMYLSSAKLKIKEEYERSHPRA